MKNRNSIAVKGWKERFERRAQLVLGFASLVLCAARARAEDVRVFGALEVTVTNDKAYRNKFDFGEIELRAALKAPSGETLNTLGFYAGDGRGGQTGNVWKLRLMPTKPGSWTYSYSWSDGTAGGSGSFNALASEIPGRLLPTGNRWRLENGAPDVPIMIPTREWFKRTETASGVSAFLDWAAKVVGARVIGTTLVYFTHAQSEVPYIKGKEGSEFNVAMWDRMNRHYDHGRDRGLGHYLMLYSDDTESPNNFGITEGSAKEQNLFKYTVARFAAYPIVVWDTGIDIGETRSNGWIDSFADWFNKSDPWGHLVSSRSGGGSGGKLPRSANFFSNGAATLPPHSAVVSSWSGQKTPTIYADRWRENYERGGFDRDRIRRAVWEVGLVGGTGVYVGANDSDGYLGSTYAADFKAAPDVGYAARFMREQIRHLGELAPHDARLSGAKEAILSAVPGKEYVAYLAVGGQVTIDVGAGAYATTWYDPRQGMSRSAAITMGGGARSFMAPGSGDWVLHLLEVGNATRDGDAPEDAGPAPSSMVDAGAGGPRDGGSEANGGSDGGAGLGAGGGGGRGGTAGDSGTQGGTVSGSTDGGASADEDRSRGKRADGGCLYAADTGETATASRVWLGALALLVLRRLKLRKGAK